MKSTTVTTPRGSNHLRSQSPSETPKKTSNVHQPSKRTTTWNSDFPDKDKILQYNDKVSNVTVKKTEAHPLSANHDQFKQQISPSKSSTTNETNGISFKLNIYQEEIALKFIGFRQKLKRQGIKNKEVLLLKFIDPDGSKQKLKPRASINDRLQSVYRKQYNLINALYYISNHSELTIEDFKEAVQLLHCEFQRRNDQIYSSSAYFWQQDRVDQYVFQNWKSNQLEIIEEYISNDQTGKTTWSNIDCDIILKLLNDERLQYKQIDVHFQYFEDAERFVKRCINDLIKLLNKVKKAKFQRTHILKVICGVSKGKQEKDTLRYYIDNYLKEEEYDYIYAPQYGVFLIKFDY